MGTSEPIRNSRELRDIIDYYKTVKPFPRNDAFICLGLYTGLRTGDILKLKWGDVICSDFKRFKNHIELCETKTGKKKKIAISKQIKKALEKELKTDKPQNPGEFIFWSGKDKNRHISRIQAYRIVKEAADHCMADPKHISTHSLRKTFGYHAWKQGTPPALLMEIFNHSSYEITKRYLGIDQDEKDKIYLNIKF